MTQTISIKDELESLSSPSAKYITLPFFADGKPLVSSADARWGMTLLTAGSMRFRWNETNESRSALLKSILVELKKPICSGNCSSDEGVCDCRLKIVPLELIHSKTVIEAKTETDTKNLHGDGIITKNPLLVPAVTVADCVPIFLYDRKNKAFGAFHSGWKGTGIAGVGVQKMKELYDSKPEDISAAIGPHIGSCCYCIDEERAEYFSENFGENCVSKIYESQRDFDPGFPFSLSLTEANLCVLRAAGILEENIVVSTDCTCCTRFENGKNIFGSFRRQAAFLPPSLDTDTRSRAMTVQAAFVYTA